MTERTDGQAEEATRNYSRSDFEAACDGYVQRATEELVETEFDPSMRGGAVLGTVLWAMVAAARSEDSRRITVTTGLLDTLVDTVVSEHEETDPARAAFALERRGDGALVAAPEASTAPYDRAGALYETAESRTVDTWSMELGGDRAHGALLQYFDDSGVAVDGSQLSATDAAERLEYKSELAARLTE